MHFCTVINRSWVAHSRALAESLRTHEPDSRLTVLVVDPLDGLIDPAAEPFAAITPAELELSDFDAMSARYGVTELCCALKPFVIKHVLDRGEAAVYLDSDVRLYAPLEGLEEELQQHPLLLAPHLLQPLPDDGREPGELAILLAGVYNLGFAAARPDPRSEDVLAWWADRLRTGSHLDPARGMVFDQRWADLMPGFSDAVGTVRDPGINYGYWRAATSPPERGGKQILVAGRPLRCMHFSGYDTDRPERLSRYDNRIDLAREPLLRELTEEFAERLRAHGHDETRRWTYGFARTASGLDLTPELRRLWDRAHREEAVAEPPFAKDAEEAFLAWLADPDPGAPGEPLGRYVRALHASTLELQQRFPDIDGDDRDGYLRWCEEQAQRKPQEILARLLQVSRSAGRRPGLHRLEQGETLGLDRGAVMVCIPVYGAQDLFAECLRSALAHTPVEVPILVADDASPDPAIAEFLRSLDAADGLYGHEVVYLRQQRNLGFPGNVNAAFAVAAPADVVVLNSDCVVAEGWLAGLRRAAYSDELVATSSALTNHGTILSIPERNTPRPSLRQDTVLDAAAEAVLEQSLRLYPRLPTAVGNCMYIRRQALDLVGDFDLAFSPGYGEEVDFSQRCLLHGLLHVAADDVFVLHHAGGSFAEDGAVHPVRDEHERIIEARYPYYQRAQTAAGRSELGPLARALSTGRRAMLGLTATIDARCLGPFLTGTQIHTLEVIRALEATGWVTLRVIVPPDLGGYAREQLSDLQRVEVISHSDVHAGMDRSDIAHRPYQVTNSNDLLVLRCAGERTVITHQDLIAYRNPGYFPGYPQWERYRRLTRQALALADQIVFISHHAAGDALGEDLVEHDRLRIVYNGVDHADTGAESREPPGVEELGERPVLLCLGTDFRHKNRLFAIRLLEALRTGHGWDGSLILAGPRVSDGSSIGEEAAYLATRPELARHVHVLPAVSEAEKEWLFERCAAVAFPTTYEGFGLMPFEAAAHDRPCLFASHSALAETLPASLATLIPWDEEASAVGVHRLLSDPEQADAQVREIRRAGAGFTWQTAGESLVKAYWATVASPVRLASQMAHDLAEVEVERDEAERKYNELWGALTPDARALLIPDGILDVPTTHALAAVGRRPLLRRVAFAPLRLGHKLRSTREDSEPEEGAITAPEALRLHFGPENLRHMSEHAPRGDTEKLTWEP